MKITNILKSVLMVTIVVALGTSCVNNIDPVTYKKGSALSLENTTTSLEIANPVISFQAGTESYTMDFKALIGANSINKIDVYSTFTDAAAATGLVSDEVLFKSFDVSMGTGNKEPFTTTFSYSDLKSGITIGGSPLPDDEFELAVGAGWALRFVGIGTDGKEYDFTNTVTIAVLSPFAGLYQTVSTAYYRIGIESSLSDWSGQVRFIGSVDEFTFSYNDYWGPFAASGGNFVFSLAEDYATTADYSLTVLDDPSQLFFSGDEMLTCQNESSQFIDVPCDGSNVLIPDFAGGAHTIILTYGYYTASGDANEGAREFYEKMVKIVD